MLERVGTPIGNNDDLWIAAHARSAARLVY